MSFTCGEPYGDDPRPRCILSWPHADRLHEDGDGDRWGRSHRPAPSMTELIPGADKTRQPEQTGENR